MYKSFGISPFGGSFFSFHINNQSLWIEVEFQTFNNLRYLFQIQAQAQIKRTSFGELECEFEAQNQTTWNPHH